MLASLDHYSHGELKEALKQLSHGAGSLKQNTKGAYGNGLQSYNQTFGTNFEATYSSISRRNPNVLDLFSGPHFLEELFNRVKLLDKERHINTLENTRVGVSVELSQDNCIDTSDEIKPIYGNLVKKETLEQVGRYSKKYGLIISRPIGGSLFLEMLTGLNEGCGKQQATCFAWIFVRNIWRLLDTDGIAYIQLSSMSTSLANYLQRLLLLQGVEVEQKNIGIYPILIIKKDKHSPSEIKKLNLH